MKKSDDKSALKQGALMGGLKLAKAYFLNSNERTTALLLLFGVILSVFGLVAFTSIFASWNVVFWTALTEMNLALYIESLQQLAVIVISYVGINVLKDYLISTLSIRWGAWLTKSLIDQYTLNHLKLARHYVDEIPNPASRIEHDSQKFVDQSLNLAVDFFQSLLMQASFLGTLWVVGGAITVVLLGTSITIPGYLVWAAIVFAGVSSLITHTIGRVLSKFSNLQTELRANFRKDMELLNEKGESVAQDHGEGYYKQSFLRSLDAIVKNAYDLLRVRIRLTAFNSFYQEIASIFPYIVAAPLYFAKKTNLGQLMQVGFAFGQVQTALSWFTNAYEPLANYRVSIGRIMALIKAMQESDLAASPQGIVVSENSSSNLIARNLDIAYPSSDRLMMHHLNIKFKAKENTLIKAPSGLGKSTFFKVMAGTWKYGAGEVSVPNAPEMCFLPQQPVIQRDTLKAVLAYPEPVDTYTNADYETVLRDVGGMEKFIERLDDSDNWSKILSGGQQQRISFARALIKKPNWLFLDESTASLDGQSEEEMYGLLKSRLNGTTFISIAHKDSVEKFHDRVITLDVGGPNNETRALETPRLSTGMG